jgi:MOSC domain-containing protein YiiM
LRILREGDIGAGDAIRILSTPSHGMTVGDVFRIFSRDRHDIGKLLDIPELSESWRSWAKHHSFRK